VSLAIDIDAVEGVLIAGQWFEVLDSSFKIESYQYVRKFGEGSYQNLLASGREPLLPKRGFIFTTWAQGTDGLRWESEPAKSAENGPDGA
jgi:hypothetical protein